MNDVYLEVTYRRGKPFAAYLYLRRGGSSPASAKVARTVEERPGVLVDFDAAGKPLGVEIIHPGRTPMADIRDVLAQVHAGPVAEAELAPLRVA